MSQLQDPVVHIEVPGGAGDCAQGSSEHEAVHYSLTPSGLDLKHAFAELGTWGTKWLPEFNGTKAKNDYTVITQTIQN